MPFLIMEPCMLYNHCMLYYMPPLVYEDDVTVHLCWMVLLFNCLLINAVKYRCSFSCCPFVFSNFQIRMAVWLISFQLPRYNFCVTHRTGYHTCWDPLLMLLIHIVDSSFYLHNFHQWESFSLYFLTLCQTVVDLVLLEPNFFILCYKVLKFKIALLSYLLGWSHDFHSACPHVCLLLNYHCKRRILECIAFCNTCHFLGS